MIVIDGPSCAGKTTILENINNYKYKIATDYIWRKIIKTVESNYDNKYYSKKERSELISFGIISFIKNKVKTFLIKNNELNPICKISNSLNCVDDKLILFDWVCYPMLKYNVIFPNTKYIFIHNSFNRLINNIISRKNNSTRSPKRVIKSYFNYYIKSKNNSIDFLNRLECIKLCEKYIKYAFENFDDIIDFINLMFIKIGLELNDLNQYITLKYDIYSDIYINNNTNNISSIISTKYL